MNRAENRRRRPLAGALVLLLALGLLAYPKLRWGAAPSATPTADEQQRTSADGDQPRGGLQLDGEALVSPAGLRYTRGSEEGHRLQHVLRHIRDLPERSIHGVFDADTQEQLIAVIDEAYAQAQRAERGVQQERDRGRTIYTVDLGRRIGYVGGQAGRRKRYPPCEKVKLILQDRHVITAYPVQR